MKQEGTAGALGLSAPMAGADAPAWAPGSISPTLLLSGPFQSVQSLPGLFLTWLLTLSDL